MGDAQTYYYATISDRVKAYFLDIGVLVAMMFGTSAIFGSMDEVSENLRIAAFVFVFLLYDPLFTSIFGGTIGHLLLGIRVGRLKQPKRNVILPLALIRYSVKFLLGWVSMLSMLFNKKNRAIHDLLVGSVVLFNHIPPDVNRLSILETPIEDSIVETDEI